MRPFIWYKTWDVNWRASERRAWVKSFMKMSHKNVFFFFFLIFDIYYVALKILTYVMSYTGYASLVKFLLEFELIEAHLSSCRHFSAYLGLLMWTRLGLFWAHIRSFWIYLGSFGLISAHLVSFRLVWAHLNSLELI